MYDRLNDVNRLGSWVSVPLALVRDESSLTTRPFSGRLAWREA
jgi:hypothetical protein